MSLLQTKIRPESARRVRYIRDIDKIPGIPPQDRERLKKVARRYVFRANDY